jgi:hypothetical protein
VWFPSLLLPKLHLVLCRYVLDSLVGGFNYLFSFPWLNFCVVTDLVVSLVNVLFLSLAWWCNLAITNSQVQWQTSYLHIWCKHLGDNIYKQWELVTISINSGSWGRW